MITLENEALRVEITPLGAELQSVYGKQTGIEYLWQGKEAWWTGRAPNLFPFVGRLYQKTYTHRGVSYPMGLHGFAAQRTLETEEAGRESCVLLLRDDGETYAMYPFHFEYRVRYALEGSRLRIGYRVKNRSGEAMFFGLGGHPGFNVPLTEGTSFEDWRLTLPGASGLKAVRFSPGGLDTGERIPFPLEGASLPLRHDLFDRDAIVLSGVPGEAVLSAPGCGHGVRVSFPGMPYVGFWHMPHTDAPYVCVEPWSALPGREGVTEELTEMADRTRLAPGEEYANDWSVEVW